MEDFCLVATHLSSLTPAPSFNVVLPTARKNVPLPSVVSDNDVPAEHATSTGLLTTGSIGTVLFRVIHGGAVVELSALSAPVPPLRIIFPALVIPDPALFLWKETELHLLVLTNIASLYRLIIPVDGLKLWQDQSENVWPREYFVKNLPRENTRECVVHAQGIYCLAVSLPNGGLLRIEAESLGYDGLDGKPFFWCQYSSSSSRYPLLQRDGWRLSFTIAHSYLPLHPSCLFRLAYLERPT